MVSQWGMAKKSTKQPLKAISFLSHREMNAAVNKSKVKHRNFSHCARDLFKQYKP